MGVELNMNAAPHSTAQKCMVALVQVGPGQTIIHSPGSCKQRMISFIQNMHPSEQSAPRYGSHLAQTRRLVVGLDHIPTTNEPLQSSFGT